MIKKKTHLTILEMLENNELIKVSEILEETKASESTIRRDLAYLEKEGLLIRVHGGAKRLDTKEEELSYTEKLSKNIGDKRKISEYAAKEVCDGDSIFLDAGTTTFEMIPFLKGKNIFVITTGIDHIGELIKYNIPCYMVGGKVKMKTKAIIGGDALEFLKKFNFDKAFLGANGVDEKFGFTTPDGEEASIKKLSKELSKQVFILADNSKLNKSTLVKFAELNEGIIITDKNADIEKIKDLTEIRRAK
ncbi:MAG: DeoR/GlpR family DNA-binding transcription regulator [Clostridium sp.]|uniref:DeoR/GlpR family DNA-binding transcription regulator n=1 Tax=Clostridium sp. TaxID=1506 RepID=UPI003F2F1557